MYYELSAEEIAHLSSADAAFAQAIEQIGPIGCEINEDLFSSVVDNIIGQQISMAAQATVCARLHDSLGDVTPAAICECTPEALQKLGMSFRKVEYMQDFARKVHSGEFDIEALKGMGDDEVIARLSALRGIGVWTAEMLMTFSMGRPNVFSFGDLAILRGLRMLHHHRSIDRKLFEKYRRRYSPYCSAASLYLWKIAGGAIPGMRDYAPKKKAAAKKKATGKGREP